LALAAPPPSSASPTAPVRPPHEPYVKFLEAAASGRREKLTGSHVLTRSQNAGTVVPRERVVNAVRARSSSRPGRDEGFTSRPREMLGRRHRDLELLEVALGSALGVVFLGVPGEEATSLSRVGCPADEE